MRVVEVHLDAHIGCRCGEVPEGEGVVTVQEDGDGRGLGADPRDIGSRRERPDLERAIRVSDELSLQLFEVDPPILVLVDDDDVGDGLAPGDLVGVVLVRSDEDDWALGWGDMGAQIISRVEVGREAQVHDLDELVDRASRTGATKEDDVFFEVASSGVGDDVACFFSKASRLQARPARLGVRVGVEGQDLITDILLDEVQCAPGGGVVGISQASWAVRPFDGALFSEDRLPDASDECLASRWSVHGLSLAVRTGGPSLLYSSARLLGASGRCV